MTPQPPEPPKPPEPPQPPEEMQEFGPPEQKEPDPGSGPDGRRLLLSERPPSGPERRDLNMPRRYSRWALWGCVTIGLVGLLFTIGFMLIYMRQPGFGAWVRFAENVTVCREQMSEVAGALQRYRADKGKMPARLEELRPTYMADDKFLRCPADPDTVDAAKRAKTTQEDENAKAAKGAARRGTSYVYMRTVPWGKGREVVVYCPHHPAPRRMPNAPNDQQIHQIPVIRQDGTVDAITGRLTDLRGSGASTDTRSGAGSKAPAPTAAPARR